ncbi:hypothetical protein ABEO46_06455 [Geobacillus stearothermophilus]|uniref:hypothetical protein n=1 Tax=Geobacillus stearothermophilus TaxID=1422 RepID=UPI003D1E962F
MDNIALLIALASLLALLFFLIRGVVWKTKGREGAKHQFKRSLISFVVMIVAMIIFGATTEPPKETAKESKQEQQTEEQKPEKTTNKQEAKPAVAQPKEKKEEPKKAEVKKEEPAKKEESKIDNSVFKYAEKVDITDARDITKHIDVVVHMSKELTPGLATRHVFAQTYDFLQQDDIKGADTITIGVIQGEIRVAQITVDVKKFQPGDQIIQSVLKAATIDKMRPEVKEFGKVTNLW